MSEWSIAIRLPTKLMDVSHPWAKIEHPENRPFPSSLVPLFQSESKCETFLMKMSSACRLIFMQINVIFIRMVSHLDSLWNRGTRELGNGLFSKCVRTFLLCLLKNQISRIRYDNLFGNKTIGRECSHLFYWFDNERIHVELKHFTRCSQELRSSRLKNCKSTGKVSLD